MVLGLSTFLLAPVAAGAQTGSPGYPQPTTNTTKDPCIGAGSIVTHSNGLTFCSTAAGVVDLGAVRVRVAGVHRCEHRARWSASAS